MSTTTKSITFISYVLISYLLIHEMVNARGGSGLGPYLILLIFQSVFALASILYLIFRQNPKRGNASQAIEHIILTIFIVAPIITFISVNA